MHTPAFYIDIATTAPEGIEAAIREAGGAVAAVVSPVQARSQAWVCGVRVSDNDEVQTLNRSFRGKDAPTNVLSFPADADMQVPDEAYYLGDIIFALETVQKQAREQQKPFENHLKHLTIHGLLHLYGFDHIQEDDAQVMETLEIHILTALNIGNPYKDKAEIKAQR